MSVLCSNATSDSPMCTVITNGYHPDSNNNNTLLKWLPGQHTAKSKLIPPTRTHSPIQRNEKDSTAVYLNYTSIWNSRMSGDRQKSPGSVDGSDTSEQRKYTVKSSRSKKPYGAIMSPTESSLSNLTTTENTDMVCTLNGFKNDVKAMSKAIEGRIRAKKLKNLQASEQAAIKAQQRLEEQQRFRLERLRAEREMRQKRVEQRRKELELAKQKRLYKLVNKSITSQPVNKAVHRPIQSTKPVVAFGSSLPRFVCLTTRDVQQQQQPANWHSKQSLSQQQRTAQKQRPTIQSACPSYCRNYMTSSQMHKSTNGNGHRSQTASVRFSKQTPRPNDDCTSVGSLPYHIVVKVKPKNGSSKIDRVEKQSQKSSTFVRSILTSSLRSERSMKKTVNNSNRANSISKDLKFTPIAPKSSSKPKTPPTTTNSKDVVLQKEFVVDNNKSNNAHLKSAVRKTLHASSFRVKPKGQTKTTTSVNDSHVTETVTHVTTDYRNDEGDCQTNDSEKDKAKIEEEYRLKMKAQRRLAQNKMKDANNITCNHQSDPTTCSTNVDLFVDGIVKYAVNQIQFENNQSLVQTSTPNPPISKSPIKRPTSLELKQQPDPIAVQRFALQQEMLSKISKSKDQLFHVEGESKNVSPSVDTNVNSPNDPTLNVGVLDNLESRKREREAEKIALRRRLDNIMSRVKSPSKDQLNVDAKLDETAAVVVTDASPTITNDQSTLSDFTLTTKTCDSPNRSSVVANMLASGRLSGNSRAAAILLNKTNNQQHLTDQADAVHNT